MIRMFVDFTMKSTSKLLQGNQTFPMEDVQRLNIFEDWNREIDQEDKVDDNPGQEFELENPQSESGPGTLQSNDNKAQQHQWYGNGQANQDCVH